MNRIELKSHKRQRRKKGLRKRIFGVPNQPRMSVFRSAKHIYAQIIDDLTGADDDPDPKKVKTQARLSVVASEELAYGCAGIALALGGSGLACAPVARMGTDEQKEEFRRLMKGVDDKGHVKLAAMALSEPATGSDISGLKTTARADGDHWIIRGSKQWITNGQSAAV
jgi:alkylation response protein AidB-like acyl-CoA dehydrogenase